MKKNIIIAISFLLLTNACSTITSTHGQIVTTGQVQKIQPGVDDKSRVRQILGSPSTTSTFNDNRWYYLTETTEDKPLDPNRLVARDLVIVDFNADGKVTKITLKNKKDGKDIEFSEQKTKTQGQSKGIIDGLIDNLGVGGF